MIRFPLPPDEAAAAAYVVRLVKALTAARGNVRAAAEALDMSEHTLRHRLKDLDLVTWNREAHPLAERQPRASAPPCPRCKSAETEPLRNFGRPVKGRFQCLSCRRWFGPENPPDAGGTGETE